MMSPQIGTRVEIERPTWEITYLMIAITMAKRSDDAQTKCGAVVTDKDHTILSTGFNGYVRGFDSAQFPNIRPEKYPFMIHAELNALLNCARKGHSTLNSTVYISGKPCSDCLQFMIQAGVDKIVYTDHSKINMVLSSEEELIFNILKSTTKAGDVLHYIPFEKVSNLLVNLNDIA